MSRIWRGIVPVAAAAGLIAAGAIPAEAASTATVSITIQAKNPNFPNVTGDTVVFIGSKPLQNATVSGTVTGGTSGETVTLLAEPFKATHFTPASKPVSLTSASQNYSFSVRPTLATKYEAQVTTGSATDGTSKVQPVYVTLLSVFGKNDVHTKCSRTECIETIKTRTIVPASAYKDESRKHVYLYLGVNRSHGTPSTKEPKYLTLSRISSASKARKVSATAFQIVLTFKIPFDGKNIRWWPNACSKDTESRDGIGLPRPHGCGASRVRSNAIYLG